MEQLPSGSWRAKVYARKDPLTGREIRFRKTRKTEVEAQIEIGMLLALARAGRQPDSGVTVAELFDQYVPVAGWDVSTEETNLGYIQNRHSHLLVHGARLRCPRAKMPKG
jgi:hypothetical protein